MGVEVRKTRQVRHLLHGYKSANIEVRSREMADLCRKKCADGSREEPQKKKKNANRQSVFVIGHIHAIAKSTKQA